MTKSGLQRMTTIFLYRNGVYIRLCLRRCFEYPHEAADSMIRLAYPFTRLTVSTRTKRRTTVSGVDASSATSYHGLEQRSVLLCCRALARSHLLTLTELHCRASCVQLHIASGSISRSPSMKLGSELCNAVASRLLCSRESTFIQDDAMTQGFPDHYRVSCNSIRS